MNTDLLEEMGQLFCVGLLKLVEDPPPIIPDSTQCQSLPSPSRSAVKKTSKNHRREDSEDTGREEEEEEEEEEDKMSETGRLVQDLSCYLLL